MPLPIDACRVVHHAKPIPSPPPLSFPLHRPQAGLERAGRLAAIHHPNLSNMLGVIAPPDDREAALRLVLPVYAPLTLAAWLRGPRMIGPYTDDRYTMRLTVLAHVAKAVAFLHSHDLAHGTLDTTTVLVEDRRWAVCLVTFFVCFPHCERRHAWLACRGGLEPGSLFD